MVYLDSSALVKLVIAEPESQALRRYLRSEPQRASCALARVEVLRAVRSHGAKALARARQVLRGSPSRVLRCGHRQLLLAVGRQLACCGRPGGVTRRPTRTRGCR